MNRLRTSATVLLFCTATLTWNAACAQARGLPAQKVRERSGSGGAIAQSLELSSLDAWLRRLVGRFHVTGNAINAGVQGLVDCSGVGDGPGVHCVSDLKSSQLRFFPRVALYGLDPATQGLRYLEVDNLSRVDHAAGTLAGDRATFQVRCPAVSYSNNYVKVTTCRRVVRIHAPPHGRFVEIWTDTYILPEWESDPRRAFHIPQHLKLNRQSTREP
jgi:hypothetical protein